MDFETILYEKDGGKARITLNRPEKLNALSMKLQRELNAALWEADNDAAVHVDHPARQRARVLRGIRPHADAVAAACARGRVRREVHERLSRHVHARGRCLAARAAAARADGDLGHPQARHRAGARLLPRRRHGPCAAQRHRRRGGRRRHRLPAGARDGLAGGAHVDVPRRPAVGEVLPAHRRQRLRRGGGRHRARMEVRARRSARVRGRGARVEDGEASTSSCWRRTSASSTSRWR